MRSASRSGVIPLPPSPGFARPPLVLIAEDEPEAAELIESILRREGCEVLIASDGQQALEMARELPRPDLILLDLELPVINGRELLATMRADSSLSGIPVWVVSGAADAATVRATDNVRKTRLLDGLARVMARLRGEMSTIAESERAPSVGTASVRATTPIGDAE
jgi:CheY-like chemotaxis protein